MLMEMEGYASKSLSMYCLNALQQGNNFCILVVILTLVANVILPNETFYTELHNLTFQQFALIAQC